MGGSNDEAPAIPGRATIELSSWIFVLASLSLLAEFVLLYLGAAQPLYYKAEPKVSWATARRVSILGVLEAVCWFVGFGLLIDWIVFHTFDVFGKSRSALTGAILKLIASAFFCVQPASQLGDPRNEFLVVGLGVPWSNFVGICLFHSGNCVDAWRMAGLFDSAAPTAHGNWPAIGTWIYTCATSLLLGADALAYFAPAPYNPPSTPAVSSSQLKLICPLQIAGASLLAIASVLYVAWARGGGRASAPPRLDRTLLADESDLAPIA